MRKLKGRNFDGNMKKSKQRACVIQIPLKWNPIYKNIKQIL